MPLLDMNPAHPSAEERALLAKDAVVLSPHKFVGGPGCPGVLLVKRSLFQDTEPSVPGMMHMWFACMVLCCVRFDGLISCATIVPELWVFR
jgi:hypothetical protein